MFKAGDVVLTGVKFVDKYGTRSIKSATFVVKFHNLLLRCKK